METSNLKVLRVEGQQATFSRIYGTKREEVRNLITAKGQRRFTVGYIQTFGNTMKFCGLRKEKAKAMVTALIHGHAGEGNHFMTCYEGDFHFFYRGTLIYKWNTYEDKGQAVPAGEFEGTMSTKNQRKEIEKAIYNFNEAVLGL